MGLKDRGSDPSFIPTFGIKVTFALLHCLDNWTRARLLLVIMSKWRRISPTPFCRSIENTPSTPGDLYGWKVLIAHLSRYLVKVFLAMFQFSLKLYNFFLLSLLYSYVPSFFLMNNIWGKKLFFSITWSLDFFWQFMIRDIKVQLCYIYTILNNLPRYTYPLLRFMNDNLK